MLALAGGFQVLTAPIAAHLVGRLAYRTRHVRRGPARPATTSRSATTPGCDRAARSGVTSGRHGAYEKPSPSRPSGSPPAEGGLLAQPRRNASSFGHVTGLRLVGAQRGELGGNVSVMSTTWSRVWCAITHTSRTVHASRPSSASSVECATGSGRRGRPRAWRPRRTPGGRGASRGFGPSHARRRQQHDVRADLPDDPADVASQPAVTVELAVAVAEEPHVGDAHGFGRSELLLAADRGDLGSGNCGVEAAGVTVGGDAVRHVDTAGRPAARWSRSPEVQVVRVRGDGQDSSDLGACEHVDSRCRSQVSIVRRKRSTTASRSARRAAARAAKPRCWKANSERPEGVSTSTGS